MTTANLTITDNDTVIQYTSVGESIFPFPFPFLANDEIRVSVDQVDQVLGVDFNLSGLGDDGGGTVTFTSATTSGELITIWQDMPFKRLTGFSTGATALLGEDLNTEFARQVRQDQQIRREIGLALRLAVDDPIQGQDMVIPVQGTRAGKFLAFNASGLPTVSEGSGGGDTSLRSDLASAVGAALGFSLVAITKSAEEITEGILIINTHYRVGDSRRYGVTADGSTDDTAALNNAFAFGANQKHPITMPAGIIIVSDTIWPVPEGFTSVTGFAQVDVRGAGRGGVTNGLTVIDGSSILTKPVMNCILLRGSYFADFVIQGPNVAPGLIAVDDMRHDSSWVTAGVRDSRYSPQCGICIDGGMGAVPPDGGYPGFTYTGTVEGSKAFTFENVSLKNHVVGFMHNPGLGAQGDNVILQGILYESCKVDLASGQAQANIITCINNDFFVSRTGFDGREYGDQQGRAPAFVNCQWGTIYEMFSTPINQAPLNVYGGRTEAMHSIGEFGGGVQAYPLSFYGTDIHLREGDQARSPYIVRTQTTVNFFGGGLDIGNLGDLCGEAAFLAAGHCYFNGTRVQMNNKDRPWITGGKNLIPVSLENVSISDGNSPAVSYGDRTRKLSLLSRISEHQSPSQHLTHGAIREYLPEINNNFVSIGVTSNIVFTDTTLAFDNTDAAGGIMVGDIIYWLMEAVGVDVVQYTVPAAKVTSVAAPAVTCDLMFTRDYYDETATPAGAEIALHEWAPSVSLSGDTAASNQLINVSPTDILQDGDWITGAYGIPANTRVLSGGGTATITLSRVASDTEVGKEVFWGRLFEASLSPIVETFIPFLAGDTTPSVKGSKKFLSSPTGVTITRFDDGIAGDEISIISKGATVYDTSTATRLIGSTVDITTAAGDVTTWICEVGGTGSSVWRLKGFVDVSVDNSAGA